MKLNKKNNLKKILNFLDFQITDKNTVIFISSVILLVIAINAAVYIKNKTNDTMITYSEIDNNAKPIEEIKEIKEIKVHIKGEVIKPDIYSINSDKRINDLIILAGGFTKNANISEINLAEKLIDGQEIIVPSKIVNKVTPTTSTTTKTKSDTTSKKIININTASKEELDLLPGIGESYAEKIIKYRQETGGFKSKDEIMKVKGIGEKKYAELKDLITI